MSDRLQITIGQYSDAGAKPINQDFHGLVIPAEPLLGSKGIAIAIADGISSSEVSQIASEAAVKGLLHDYYCTSEAWSVQTSVERVLRATNAWLHAQTQRSDHRFDRDRGYVCTLSALVLKGGTAHLFHVGDARIHRLQAGDASVEQLTDRPPGALVGCAEPPRPGAGRRCSGRDRPPHVGAAGRRHVSADHRRGA